LGNKKITVEHAFSQKINISERKRKSIDIETQSKDKKSESSRLFEKTFETGKIFIRNFSNQCSQEDIKNLFSQFGFVSSFFVYPYKFGKKSSNEAFVQFALPECAIKAAFFLDGKIFRGRILHILPFFPRFLNLNPKKEEFLFSKFKKIRKNMEIENSINSRLWFTFFVCPESLVKIFMNKFGKNKKVMTNYESIKLNFKKMAITESRLQNEIKTILGLQGIDINTFNPIFIKKKSKRIFFLKNFGDFSIVYFKKTLEKFGKIKKMILVCSANFILVEFQKKKDANIAFIYLEKKNNNRKNFFIAWAPLNSSKNFPKEYKKYKSRKNLNYFFSKNSLFLKERKSKNFISNNIKQKKIKKLKENINDSQMGFKEILFFKNKKKKFTKKETFHYKILVRNIPFGVNLEKIKKIFENFGKIISIRMPKNKLGKHRGFAFIEFKSLEEAKKTVLSTQNIHLFNRHLFVSLIKCK